MKHRRVRAGSFARGWHAQAVGAGMADEPQRVHGGASLCHATRALAGLRPLAVLGPLAGIVVSLVGALPARGAEIPFTEHLITEDPDELPRRLRERISRTLVDEGYRSAAAAFYTVVKITASDGAAGDFFGSSVAISGDTAIVGAYFGDGNATDSGSAYVYRRDEGGVDNWGEVTKITASDGVSSQHFGEGVAISGDTAIVGAREGAGNESMSGSAYVYRRDQGGVDNWGEVTKITASDGAAGDFFGRWVAISGDTAIVGAYFGDGNATDSGSAYVYRRDEGGVDNWGQVTKITASDGAASDTFGGSVAISGDTAIVAASLDDDNGKYSGSAYMFFTPAEICGDCPTDRDGNGETEAFDLAILLGAWGPVTPDSACLDADGNGFIEAFDLAVLLGAWGPC